MAAPYQDFAIHLPDRDPERGLCRQRLQRQLAQLSYAGDMVFADGTVLQMASVIGNPAEGYVVTLAVGFSL